MFAAEEGGAMKAELMIEAVTGESRPNHMTSKEAIDNMIDEETREVYTALADAAMRFVADLADAINRVGQTVH
jgi:hypothetical protein